MGIFPFSASGILDLNKPRLGPLAVLGFCPTFPIFLNRYVDLRVVQEVGVKSHGISDSFEAACLSLCVVCSWLKATREDESFLGGRREMCACVCSQTPLAVFVVLW